MITYIQDTISFIWLIIKITIFLLFIAVPHQAFVYAVTPDSYTKIIQNINQLNPGITQVYTQDAVFTLNQGREIPTVEINKNFRGQFLNYEPEGLDFFTFGTENNNLTGELERIDYLYSHPDSDWTGPSAGVSHNMYPHMTDKAFSGHINVLTLVHHNIINDADNWLWLVWGVTILWCLIEWLNKSPIKILNKIAITFAVVWVIAFIFPSSDNISKFHLKASDYNKDNLIYFTQETGDGDKNIVATTYDTIIVNNFLFTDTYEYIRSHK